MADSGDPRLRNPSTQSARDAFADVYHGRGLRDELPPDSPVLHERTSLLWVIFCPIPGVIVGWIGTALIAVLLRLTIGANWNWEGPLGLYFGFTGAAVGAITFFVVNLRRYLRGR